MRTFKVDLFSTREELDEMEKQLSEKYGEPCVVLPTYLQPEEQKIGYLCDGYACEECHPEYCHHTTDIKHAKNFAELADGRWMEEVKDDRHEKV